MSQSYREAQKIQEKLSDVANGLMPSKIATFKKSLARARSMIDLLPLFKKEEESKMPAPSSVARSHSEPILIASKLTPSISTELFRPQVKDIEALECRLRQRFSKTSAREEKLAVLLNALSMRNESLKNPFYTHRVLVAMKEFIQDRGEPRDYSEHYCLSNKIKWDTRLCRQIKLGSKKCSMG